MSTQFNGVGGAPGIALGRAFCLRAAPQSDTFAPDNEKPDAALERFAAAQIAAAARLNAVAEDQRSSGFEHEAGIFEFQAMLVEDPALTDEVTRLVHEGNPLNVALSAAIDLVRASIAAIDDEYLRERAADVDAVGQEIGRALPGGGSALASCRRRDHRRARSDAGRDSRAARRHGRRFRHGLWRADRPHCHSGARAGHSRRGRPGRSGARLSRRHRADPRRRGGAADRRA